MEVIAKSKKVVLITTAKDMKYRIVEGDDGLYFEKVNGNDRLIIKPMGTNQIHLK